VVTQDRNMQTSPMSKVQRQYFKFPKYMEDPYERERVLENVNIQTYLGKEKEG
jgi:hypothetical protein